jgi:hypothetical protein
MSAALTVIFHDPDVEAMRRRHAANWDRLHAANDALIFETGRLSAVLGRAERDLDDGFAALERLRIWQDDCRLRDERAWMEKAE